MPDPTTPTNPTQTPTDPGPGATSPGDTPQVSEFIQSLGEGFQTHEAFTGIEDATGLATKYQELHQAHADLTAKHTELEGGIPKPPESPDQYTAPDIPEGVKVDENGLTAFKEAAHKLGMSNEQFNAALGVQFQMQADKLAAIKQEHVKLMTDMKAEIGDGFQDAVAKVNTLVETLGLNEMLGQYDASEEGSIMGTNPHIFRALLKISEAVSPDSLAPASGPGTVERKTTTDGRPMLNYPSMAKKT
jgi:hypothetical protein